MPINKSKYQALKSNPIPKTIISLVTHKLTSDDNDNDVK